MSSPFALLQAKFQVRRGRFPAADGDADLERQKAQTMHHLIRGKWSEIGFKPSPEPAL